jgi:4-hydroxybenzoate polyprenyltransferase
MPRLRTFLVLGRVSNLPTVWSNCLAGWWLGGGGNFEKLPVLLVGVSFLYLGGMYLNDAFDVEFDRQHRQERPIPSGAISIGAVWRFGLAWLLVGALCLMGLGLKTGAIGLVLSLCILAYDSIHKRTAVSPVLMGACRFLVYLVAAATAADGVTGRVIWCALALGGYVAGLSFLARRESTRDPTNWWPLILTATPILLALIMNANNYRKPALALSGVVVLWILLSLRPALGSTNGHVGKAVARLLAGIVLVDALAVPDLLLRTDARHELGLIFLSLFLMTWLLQRLVPAT